MQSGRRERSRRDGRERPNRRRSNHAAAAAEAHAPLDVPDHPLIPDAEPELIDTPAAWADLLEHARAAGRFAYDTEFIGERSYFPKLCLIQIATPERVAVVDALAGLDLRPLWELLADPGVEKVVHAGGQDLEPASRHIGRPAARVFDTQVAAGFIHLPYPLSLRWLVEHLLDLRLGKGLTFTSWDERPLPAAHLRYAADDVRYLPALHAAMADRLAAAGHAEYAERECAAVCEAAALPFDPDEQLKRMRAARGLSGKRRAVVHELLALRDEGAREQDLPPRTFLRDEVLIELGRRMVRSVEQLGSVRGLPRPVVEEYGERIMAATRRGVERAAGDAAPEPTAHQEESATDRFRIDSLWAAVGSYCLGRGIDPALLGSRQALAEYERAERTGRPTEGLRLMRGWRRDFIGPFLAELLGGRGRLSLSWSEGRLRAEA